MEKNKKKNNNNSSYSLVFGRWPQTKTIGMVWAAILWYIKSASMVKRVDKMAVNEGRIFFALVQWGIPSFSLKALIKIVTDYIMTNF